MITSLPRQQLDTAVWVTPEQQSNSSSLLSHVPDNSPSHQNLQIDLKFVKTFVIDGRIDFFFKPGTSGWSLVWGFSYPPHHSLLGNHTAEDEFGLDWLFLVYCPSIFLPLFSVILLLWLWFSTACLPLSLAWSLVFLALTLVRQECSLSQKLTDWTTLPGPWSPGIHLSLHQDAGAKVL